MSKHLRIYFPTSLTVGLAIFVIIIKLHHNNEHAGNFVQGAYPPPSLVQTPSGITNTYRINLPLIYSFIIPYPTNSYYIFSTNDVWELGCNLGNKTRPTTGVQDNFVFLDFGNPNQDSQGNLGTVLYNQSPITNNQIASAVVVFANGFYYCSSNYPPNANDTLLLQSVLIVAEALLQI